MTAGSHRAPSWLTRRATTAESTVAHPSGGPEGPPIRGRGEPSHHPADATRPARTVRVGSDRALLELATLALGEAAPDAEALVVHQGVLEALAAYLACQADLLGLPGRAALLGEERLGVGLRAERALLPTRFLGVRVEEKQFPHGSRPFDPVLCDPALSPCVVRPWCGLLLGSDTH